MLLSRINAETVALDIAMLFMEDDAMAVSGDRCFSKAALGVGLPARGGDTHALRGPRPQVAGEDVVLTVGVVPNEIGCTRSKRDDVAIP